jgi:hypothetical protein
MNHYYTQEEFEFIDEHSDLTRAELTDLFNAHFGLDLAVKTIKSFCTRHWLSAGSDGCFKPGIVPWNTGKKGVCFGGVATQFKKGDRPENWMPVGSERVNADGYVDVKISDTHPRKWKRWKSKAVLIWEAANGPVPPGHAVIFGDGDNRNFDPDNLLLVTRAQLVRLNQSNLIQNDAELTKIGILVADVLNRIGERRRARKAARSAS